MTTATIHRYQYEFFHQVRNGGSRGWEDRPQPQNMELLQKMQNVAPDSEHLNTLDDSKGFQCDVHLDISPPQDGFATHMFTHDVQIL